MMRWWIFHILLHHRTPSILPLSLFVGKIKPPKILFMSLLLNGIKWNGMCLCVAFAFSFSATILLAFRMKRAALRRQEYQIEGEEEFIKRTITLFFRFIAVCLKLACFKMLYNCTHVCLNNHITAWRRRNFQAFTIKKILLGGVLGYALPLSFSYFCKLELLQQQPLLSIMMLMHLIMMVCESSNICELRTWG